MSKLSHTRVLVIDDEEDVIELFKLMLRHDNVDVITAQDGKIGLQKALKDKPNVVITDLMMPEVDGFTVMEAILKESPEVPVIVVTAYGSMNTAIRALRLGAFDFLLKPMDSTTVSATVARAARQQLTERLKEKHHQITEGLGTSRNPTYIARKLLTLSAHTLGAEHGFMWWADHSFPAIPLNPNDTELQSTLFDWVQRIGIHGPIPEKFMARLEPSIRIEDTSPFSGSLVSIPLFTHNTTHGTLLLAHSQPNYFDQQDLSFLQNLAPFSALAIANARTYTHLEASNQRLTTLQSINALTYNAELPLNRILRLAVEGIRQNMGYPVVFLAMPDHNTGRLIIRAAAGHLDRFLRRRGDTPTRHIAFSLENKENPLTQTYQAQKILDMPIDKWVQALKDVQAVDMANAVSQNNVSSCTAFPLWGAEKIIGILVIGYAVPTLPYDEQTLLVSLTNQLSLVITNASLYQAEKQGRKEMSALYRAGLVITSTLSHTEVLKAIIQQIIDLTFAEGCIIARWDEARDLEIVELYLQKTESTWLEKAPPGTAYSLTNRPLVKETLETQSLKIIRSDDSEIPVDERAWMVQSGAKLRLILPLIIRKRSIGVIELISIQDQPIFTRQIIRITEGLAAQASIALENARLHEGEVKRMEHEMDLAHRIQVSLLPHETPDVPGLSIAARSVSARLVGGDFYRYLSLPNGKFGVVIGDVSGKGVPSALFMAVTITALDNQIRQHASPENILYRLNNILYPRMKANRMNTGLLIITFDMENNKAEVANAGMIAPLIREEKNRFTWVDVSGIPVGAIPQSSYQNTTLALVNDTTIILASDGILEAMNPAGEIYGFERFQQSAQNLVPHLSSEEILEHIWQDTANHIHDAEPHDDMTLLVIQTKNHS